MTSITPFLWFDNNVPEAVAFYKSVFPNARVETVNDFMASFELEGQKFNALNGGPQYKFNEAISLLHQRRDPGRGGLFLEQLTADGGEQSRCGWLRTNLGCPAGRAQGAWPLPRRSRSAKADRAMQAMMKMQKIVISDLEKAFAG